MKRNLLGLFAIVLAIAVSSFTVKRVTNYYLVYKGSGVQTSLSNYNAPTTATQSHVFTGVAILNWFRVVDQDNDGVEQAEFDNDFEIYDVANDGANSLNDEASDIQGQLDLKNSEL